MNVEYWLSTKDWSSWYDLDEYIDNAEETVKAIAELYQQNRSVFLKCEEKMVNCEEKLIKIIMDGIELGMTSFSKNNREFFIADNHLSCRVCNHMESQYLIDILSSQDDWHKYHGYSPYIDVINRFKTKYIASSPTEDYCYYAIFCNNRIVGYFGLKRIGHHEQLANIEYYILPEFRGQNIIYKALSSFFKCGEISITGLKGIKGSARVDNVPSNSILRKLGFEHLGLQKYDSGNLSGPPSDSNLYFFDLKGE